MGCDYLFFRFLGDTENGVISQSHLSFPKMWARRANPCLSRTGNQMDSSAVLKWEGRELLSAQGLGAAVCFFFFQGN